jgi:hypothetical protein
MGGSELPQVTDRLCQNVGNYHSTLFSIPQERRSKDVELRIFFSEILNGRDHVDYGHKGREAGVYSALQLDADCTLIR